jgi:hypothetical protein
MAVRRTPAEWQQLITEQAEGQLPIRDFCRERDLALSSFGYWKRRLRGRPSAPAVSRVFVPVAVTQRSDVTVAVGPATVTLSSSVSPQWLAAFVKALQV